MEQAIKRQISESIFANVVDYFSNSITGVNFIEKHISSIVPLTDEQEEKICDILLEYNRDWENVECDSEGATIEQDRELDLVLENCAASIVKLLV